jgi:hypothetical protein
MLSLSLLLVASRAERYYPVLPDLLDICFHIVVIFLSVAGYDRAFFSAPGTFGRVPGFVFLGFGTPFFCVPG